MKRYFQWAGAVLVAVVLLIVFASGLFPKHMACEKFFDYYGYPSAAPESTSTEIVPDWLIHADCQGVENDLYLAYYFIGIGVFLLAVGFVLRE